MMDWIEGLIPVALVLLVIGVVVAGVQAQRADEAFMAECQADGRKHYECQAMLRGAPAAPVMVPMVVK